MRTIITGLLACLAGAVPVLAGPYPDRPVTIVVPFGKGTTADLIAACLFVALRENKVKPSDPFRWHTDEWL